MLSTSFNPLLSYSFLMTGTQDIYILQARNLIVNWKLVEFFCHLWANFLISVKVVFFFLQIDRQNKLGFSDSQFPYLFISVGILSCVWRPFITVIYFLEAGLHLLPSSCIIRSIYMFEFNLLGGPIF